jgi:energy-coupling factor transporter transmembrane protein EcfT
MATPAGLSHVAAVSFLAARVAPTGSFWLSLAGGAAVAREAEVRGMRSGYASSAAAMLETVAIVGPLRLNAPLTQAVSAPLLGAMQARGRRPLTQFLACLAIRLVHYAIITAFTVLILLGPKAYAGTYRNLFGWIPFLPHGLEGALILTAIGNVLFAILFSAIQIGFYRHALTGWLERTPSQSEPRAAREQAAPPQTAGTDPRVALVAATVVTIVLLFSHSWIVLAAVAAWLAVAATMARYRDRDILRVGILLALIVAAGTLAASLIGGLGADEAASRAVRAALLVMVPTWLRLAAGSAGLREAFRRMLHRVRVVPGAEEAGEILSELDSGALLEASAKSLRDRLKGITAGPMEIANAVLAWAAQEAQSLPVHEPRPISQLRLRPRDATLVFSVLLPASALAVVLVPS